MSTVPAESLTGCPAQSDLQCSGWIDVNRCQIQTCDCYDSGIDKDAAAGYYHTSDNAYFRCSGAGQSIDCTAAAEAASQHCM